MTKIIKADICTIGAGSGNLSVTSGAVQLGLMTPAAALGLFVMTMVIELFVYPGTTDHYHWMLLLGILATHGSGKFGVDFWLLKR